MFLLEPKSAMQMNPDRLLILAFCLGLSACATAPTQEMSDARLALRAADEAGARSVAGASYTQAKTLLDRAESRLEAGNYPAARADALEAQKAADRAGTLADVLTNARMAIDQARSLNGLWTTAEHAYQDARRAAGHSDEPKALQEANIARTDALLGINQARLERAKFEWADCQTRHPRLDARAVERIDRLIRTDRGEAALTAERKICTD